MSTELALAIAVVVAVVVVVVFMKIRASFKKADVAEDFIIAPETTSEHTITVDESQATVPASEPITVPADPLLAEETAAPAVEEAPAPTEEAAHAEPSPIDEQLESIVSQITTEAPAATEQVAEVPKPVKTKKDSTKKSTKKLSKKDANLANFIDTISKSSEKKTRGRKKKTDDVKIIVTAPLGKSKASKKKKKA